MSFTPSNFTVTLTGIIKLSDIKKVFNFANKRIPFSSFYKNSTYVPNVSWLSTIPISGPIRFSNFRNTTNIKLCTFSKDTNGDSITAIESYVQESEIFIDIPNDFRVIDYLRLIFSANTNATDAIDDFCNNTNNLLIIHNTWWINDNIINN